MQQGGHLYSPLSELAMRRSLVDSIRDCEDSIIQKHCDRRRNFTHVSKYILSSSELQ